ncbi:MAG: hypothetical protein VX234_14055, partial [Pseudomonadota bacterium]|nr:hypothetical protein [Pseudomonadota bacterium]
MVLSIVLFFVRIISSKSIIEASEDFDWASIRRFIDSQTNCFQFDKYLLLSHGHPHEEDNQDGAIRVAGRTHQGPLYGPGPRDTGLERENHREVIEKV